MSHISFEKERFYVTPADEADDSPQKRGQEEKEQVEAVEGKLDSASVKAMIMQALSFVSEVEKAIGNVDFNAIAGLAQNQDMECVFEILGLSKRLPGKLLLNDIRRFICPKLNRLPLKKGKIQAGYKNSKLDGLFF